MVTTQLICAFVFVCTKSRFSHDAADFIFEMVTNVQGNIFLWFLVPKWFNLYIFFWHGIRSIKHFIYIFLIQKTLVNMKLCKHRFCSSTVFVHIEQKWLATATKIVVLTKMVAISTDFVHFGQKKLVMSMWSAASTTFVRFGINLDND